MRIDRTQTTQMYISLHVFVVIVYTVSHFCNPLCIMFCNSAVGIELTSDFFRLFRWPQIAVFTFLISSSALSLVQARSSFP